MAKTNETAETVEQEVLPAETEKPEAVQGEVLEGDGAAKTVQTDGVRARRAFMLKQFIPNPDWINKEVVARGKGAKATVGRIWGFATAIERRTNDIQGKLVESIAVKGVFQSEGYLDGELGEASMVFFPMAYAEKIAAVFDSQPGIRMVEVDCDIGIEATGKTIPYEWVVVAYREGEEMAVLKRIKSSRPRPAALLTGPGAAAIEDKSKA